MSTSDQLTAALREWVGVSMRRSMRHLLLYSRESGLSMSQMGALLLVHRKGVGGVSDIGDHLGITSAAASQMLERLVQQGIVVRSEDPHDRRVKQIALTQKGRRILQESIQARQSWVDDLARLLTPAEQKQVTAALNMLVEKSGQLETVPVTVGSVES
jgi:DNA-binding MarR family transcriptional regulator